LFTAMTGIFTPAYSVSKTTGSDGDATYCSFQNENRVLGSRSSTKPAEQCKDCQP
jgi:hypothetical protein